MTWFEAALGRWVVKHRWWIIIAAILTKIQHFGTLPKYLEPGFLITQRNFPRTISHPTPDRQADPHHY